MTINGDNDMDDTDTTAHLYPRSTPFAPKDVKGTLRCIHYQSDPRYMWWTYHQYKLGDADSNIDVSSDMVTWIGRNADKSDLIS